MISLLASILKLIVVIPIMIAVYVFAFLLVCLIFIGIAAICAAPFILIIGLVLWIFF